MALEKLTNEEREELAQNAMLVAKSALDIINPDFTKINTGQLAAAAAACLLAGQHLERLVFAVVADEV